MSKFVRSSKYRHVFGSAPRNCWDGVKLTKNAWDSNFVAVNPSYVAISWQVGGGGAVGIINTNVVSKLDKVPMITGHKGAVVDLEWNPFNDNILATVSEDCYGKIWQIPNDFSGTLDKEVQILKGHQRKIGYVAWNPIAENVLATGGTDLTVKIWDVTTGDEKLNFKQGESGIINSLNWNYDGSTLVTFSKDKKIRVFDPRSPNPAAEANAHTGTKGGRAIWMGKHDKIFSVGFGSSSERQYFVFDSKNLSAPLVGPTTIDHSAGVLMPFYDEDSDLIFLPGKGDMNIRYYEFESGAKKDELSTETKPEIFYLSLYASTKDPLSAVGMMPKRGIDVNTNEIVKLFCVYGTKLEPVSFKVPRKSDLFAEDIFPDCRSDEPSLTPDQWFAGESAKPKVKSLKGGFQKREVTHTEYQKKEENDTGAPASGTASNDALQKENADLRAKVAALEAEIAKLNALLSGD